MSQRLFVGDPAGWRRHTCLCCQAFKFGVPGSRCLNSPVLVCGRIEAANSEMWQETRSLP